MIPLVIASVRGPCHEAFRKAFDWWIALEYLFAKSGIC